MNVKINTKEKFIVLTPEAADISANMTEDVGKLGEYAVEKKPHLVINLENVRSIAAAAARKFSDVQQEFYNLDHSFVVCEMQPAVKKVFDDEELTDLMNITPTESEAWDIVQMEEIERDLMNDFGEEEESI